MSAKTTGPALPEPLRHAAGAKSDADFAREVRAHYDTHASVRFIVDVFEAVHAGAAPLRTSADFYDRFAARQLMDAFDPRPDLRARIVHAITGGPHALLRRMPAGDLATQLELLVEDDIPIEERNVRSEPDRLLSVHDLYLKYIDRIDACSYLSLRDLWSYESRDAWWNRNDETARRLLIAELKSVRRHKILTDSEFLDRIGNDVFEEKVPLAVRTLIRTAARKAAADGRVFTDTDVFECIRGGDVARDLVDELAACMPFSLLRAIVEHAAASLGLIAGATPTPTPSTASPSSSATGSATPSIRPAAAGHSPIPSARPPAGVAAAGSSPSPSIRPPGSGTSPSSAISASIPTRTPSVAPPAMRPATASVPPPAPTAVGGATAAVSKSVEELTPLIEDEHFGAEITSDVEPVKPKEEFDESVTTQVTRGIPNPRGRK